MNCPNCNKEIPEGKSFCPECGAPLNAAPEAKPSKQKKPITKKWWFWVIIALVVIVIIGSAASGGKDEDSPAVNAGTSTTAQSPSVNTAVTEEAAKEIVIYEKDGIKITYVESSEDFLANNFKLLVDNQTSRNITVSTENLSVNGFSVDSWFYAQVAAGKKKNENLEIYSSSLTDNNIAKIENVEFSLHIIDNDTYDTIDDSDVITLSF